MTWEFATPQQVTEKRTKDENLRKLRIIKKELERLKELINEVLIPSIIIATEEIKSFPNETIPNDRSEYFDLKLNEYFEDAPNKTIRELLSDAGWILQESAKGFEVKPK